MLWLVPRLFTALGIRVSQASRLLTTSVRWRRGWFRPCTARRRPVKGRGRWRCGRWRSV
jgi:hypothetical protein